MRSLDEDLGESRILVIAVTHESGAKGEERPKGGTDSIDRERSAEIPPRQFLTASEHSCL